RNCRPAVARTLPAVWFLTVSEPEPPRGLLSRTPWGTGGRPLSVISRIPSRRLFMQHRSKLPGLSRWYVLAVVAGLLPPSPRLGLEWPQWLGPNREGVWRETGLAEKSPPGGPKVRWRVPTGTGYSGPAVAEGRVYVMDRQRAKDAEGKPARATR